MKRKCICFVVSSPFTAKTFLSGHIRKLSKEYDIHLVANFGDVSLAIFDGLPLKEIKDIPILRNLNVQKDFRALLSLRKYFLEKKFDAVHTVTPKAGLLGNLASNLAKINVRIHIFTGQVWHTKTGIFKRLLIFLDKLIVWNATHILVDGESQRQFLIEKSIVKDSNSFLLGKGSISGVDTDRFVPDVIIKQQVRRELGINENEVVFMFLGRMNRDKGINELAEAFNKLRNKYGNVRLLLVGGDEDNMTPIVSQKIKHTDSVIFYGRTPMPERLLQACDVFCMPSYREGFGTSIIEASLLEKPVICSDTYGLMETIIDNRTGLRHKVKDIDSLYLAMEKLNYKQALRESLGKKGREYVLENFSAQIISEKWLEFYKNNV